MGGSHVHINSGTFGSILILLIYKDVNLTALTKVEIA
jgi:hypothetical protein